MDFAVDHLIDCIIKEGQTKLFYLNLSGNNISDKSMRSIGMYLKNINVSG